MSKFGKKLALLALAVTFILASTALPVQASTNPGTVSLASTCLTGHLCLYKDSNYSGTEEEWQTPAPGSCLSLVGTAFDNQVSSLHNYLPNSIVLHLGSCGDTTTHWTINSGGSAANLNALPYYPYWNDAISSITINF